MTRSNRDRRIDYVEFTVTDLSRARAFYGAAFGWTFTEYGPDYLAFHDGAREGGFTRADTPPVAGGPLVILYADDLDAMERCVAEVGGRITTPAFDFPGGRRFHFADPDGNELAMWNEPDA